MKTISILEKELVEAFKNIEVLEIAYKEQTQKFETEKNKYVKIQEELDSLKSKTQRLKSVCVQAYSKKLDILVK